MRPHPFYAILNTVQVRFKNGLFVFLPALDLNVFQFGSAEGFDEGFGQAGIRHQRNVVIDGAAADTVPVGQFAFTVVFRNVHNQVELMVGNHLHHVVFGVRTFIRPEYRSSRNTV